MGAKRDMEKTEAKMMQIEGRQAALEPKPISYIATGYADLDKSLYGGIPKNYSIVLTSLSCDERELLIKSFLETGAKQGEVTFYVTIDPGDMKSLVESFQPCFYLFVCNPQADAIVKSLPNVFKLKGVENLTEISIALTSAIHKLDSSQKGQRRICIDLVSDVLLQHHAVQTRRWLAALIPELKSAGFSTLAVIDPRMHPSEELYAILGLFEGEISICEKETEKGIQKFLKINKMSNQKYSDNELLLRREDLQKS
jgi:KaiC/GvpD/RAD55 family RecA-like ATPase